MGEERLGLLCVCVGLSEFERQCCVYLGMCAFWGHCMHPCTADLVCCAESIPLALTPLAHYSLPSIVPVLVMITSFQPSLYWTDCAIVYLGSTMECYSHAVTFMCWCRACMPALLEGADTLIMWPWWSGIDSIRRWSFLVLFHTFDLHVCGVKSRTSPLKQTCFFNLLLEIYSDGVYISVLHCSSLQIKVRQPANDSILCGVRVYLWRA